MSIGSPISTSQPRASVGEAQAPAQGPVASGCSLPIADQITPLVLTYQEAPNLQRTLEKLAGARQVIVVDSFSTDATAEIAKSFPLVNFVQRKFDEHSMQWNFGLSLCSTEWVLALDADYVLTDELIGELKTFSPPAELAAFFVQFKYCIWGHPLRGSLYPPRAVLFRRNSCHYEQDGHTQRLRVSGKTGWLRGEILHDDRKPLSHWLWAQEKYADLEARKLLSTPASELRFQDQLRRKIILAPPLVLLFTLLCRGLVLDGLPGLAYVLQRTAAEIILSLKLVELQLKKLKTEKIKN